MQGENKKRAKVKQIINSFHTLTFGTKHTFTGVRNDKNKLREHHSHAHLKVKHRFFFLETNTKKYKMI